MLPTPESTLAATSCACCSSGNCGNACCATDDDAAPTDELTMSGLCGMGSPAPPPDWQRWSLPKHLPAAATLTVESTAAALFPEGRDRVLASADLAPPSPIPIAA